RDGLFVRRAGRNPRQAHARRRAQGRAAGAAASGGGNESVKPTPSLEDVAGAIIDGTPVDWNSVDSSVDLNDQTLVQQLKTLAALRVVARQPAVFAGPD